VATASNRPINADKRPQTTFFHVFAREWGHTVAANPCAGVTAFTERGRDADIEDATYKAVWGAADFGVELLDVAQSLAAPPRANLLPESTNFAKCPGSKGGMEPWLLRDSSPVVNGRSHMYWAGPKRNRVTLSSTS
jgi:hypothetical protein